MNHCPHFALTDNTPISHPHGQHMRWILWVFNDVTAHWPDGWTILVSGYPKLVQWLSLCYHVSYKPGSIGLLRSKTVSMTTLWQSVWQTYRHTNVKGSQPDNFIVVSRTILQPIKWYQAFCCDGCSAVQKTNTESKVNGLYCDKKYVHTAFSHISNSNFDLQTEPWLLYNIHSLTHVCIALLCHSLTNSHTHSFPLAYLASSGSTEQYSMATGRVPP